MKYKNMAVAVGIAAALLAAGCSGAPKEYPARAITMIVPYGAGGTADIVGRRLAAQMEAALGQAITVINQAGASGSVGCRTVLDAPADGYTLLLAADSLGTQRVMGVSEISSDDFAPILAAANDPKLIVVEKSSPYHTMEELAADLKERPGKIRMSHTGPGGSGHVQGLIYGKFGMEAAMTSYNSGSECIVAVLGKQVDFTNSNLSTVKGYLDSGDLRALAVSGVRRLTAYPELPVLAELFPEMEPYLELPFTPLSIVVREGTPQEVTDRLRAAAAAAVETEDWKSFADQNCLDRLYESYPDAESARAFYRQWESTVSWLIYDAGAAKYSPEKFGIPRP